MFVRTRVVDPVNISPGGSLLEKILASPFSPQRCAIRGHVQRLVLGRVVFELGGVLGS